MKRDIFLVESYWWNLQDDAGEINRNIWIISKGFYVSKLKLNRMYKVLKWKDTPNVNFIEGKGIE